MKGRIHHYARRSFSAVNLTNNYDLIPRIDLSQNIDYLIPRILKAADSGGPGFFYVTNHDISENIIENAINAAHTFHSQSLDFKLDICDTKFGGKGKGYVPQGSEGAYEKDVTDVRPDYEEATTQLNQRASFVTRFPEIPRPYLTDYPQFVNSLLPHDRIGDLKTAAEGARRFFDPNQWPCSQTLPEFKSDMETYYAATNILATRMYSLFHHILKITLACDDDIFQYDRGMMTHNAVHYPIMDTGTGNSSMGISDHTDWELFTLLYPTVFPKEANTMEPVYTGLEVWFQDQWIAVPHLPGTIIVNQGEMLGRLSKGRLKPPVHRVTMQNPNERISLVSFWAPNYETLLPESTSKTGHVLSGEFYLKRNAMI